MADTKVEIDTESPLSALIDRAISGQDIITLTTNGQEKAVLLSVEAFEHLIGIQASRQRDLMSIDELRSQFKQALAEAGYNTRDQIVDLVQEIKQEMVLERQNLSPDE